MMKNKKRLAIRPWEFDKYEMKKATNIQILYESILEYCNIVRAQGTWLIIKIAKIHFEIPILR